MSSHREAPEISKDPVADSTDLYAFVSPDKPDTVTLIANYVPLQAPAGGPNFYEFGDDVRYEIHIDNDGDAKADVSYRIDFKTEYTNPHTFLYNTGPITLSGGEVDATNWNRRQFYTVRRTAAGKTTVLATGLACPPCNVGPLSTPDYADKPARKGEPEDFTKAFIHKLDSGETVFAGQRAEGFYVDLGAVFDLGDLRPIAADHATFGLPVLASMPGVNTTAAVNVHSIAIQVPMTKLTADGKAATDPSSSSSVIGVWTSASRQAATMRDTSGRPQGSGPYVQVSRLGNPLFNELLVPIVRKDEWNASKPAGDSAYVQGVADPELGRLIPVLYTPDGGSTLFPHLAALNKKIAQGKATRDDLVAVLLTGIPAGALSVAPTFQNYTGPTQADMLRLNLAIPPTRKPNNLGLLGLDAAGFPNGRRVFDDVAVIELQAVAGTTYALVHSNYTPDAAIPAVDDGLVKTNKDGSRDDSDLTAKGTVAFLSAFPYLGTPHNGYYTPAKTPTATPPAPVPH